MNAPQRLNVMTRAQLIERILKLEAANEKCGEAIAAAVQAEREARLADIDMLEDIAYKATGHVAAANYQERHDEARMWIRNAWKAATIRARNAQEERKS